MIYLDLSGGDPFAAPAPAMPPRSRLFSLPPVDIGTSQQESLISLLVRTAYAHSVNPRGLIGKVFPAAEPAISELSYSTFFTRYAGTINGLGRYAELFAAAMEKLTGQARLRHLTMLPWQELFPHNGQGLLARHPRWCPVCLFQQRLRGEETVIPLIWSLEAVQICHRHRRYLESQCPHCGRRQPFVPRYPDLAVCDYCCQSLVADLALSGNLGRGSPGKQEYWVAEATGDMLARQSEERLSPTAARFRAFVLDAVAASADGNRAAFCRAIGLRGYALNGWINKDERPSMIQLLKVCYGVKAMPSDIFLMNEGYLERNALRQPAGALKQRARNPRLTPDRRGELERFVRTRLCSPECPPVSIVAADLGLTARCLRYWFPELCRQLTARYREEARLRSAEFRAKQCLRVAEIVRQLREAGEYPSFRKANNLLRQERMSLVQPHLREAYRAATGQEGN